MSGNGLTTGIFVVLMVVAFYFLLIRPQKRRQQEQQKVQKSMEPGVRVMLSSGIYATVVSVGDKQAVVELAPGMQVTVLKQVIMQVITPDSPYAEDSATPADTHEPFADPEANSIDSANPDSANPDSDKPDSEKA